MDLTLLQAILAVLSGFAVGFALGLIGGGGSILAVPLLLCVVGLPSAHVAIGTSALAVAANAFINLAQHARNPGTLHFRRFRARVGSWADKSAILPQPQPSTGLPRSKRSSGK